MYDIFEQLTVNGIHGESGDLALDLVVEADKKEPEVST